MLLLLLGAIFSTEALCGQDGAALFEQKCAMCHQTSRPQDRSTLVAPPVMGVMRHVKMHYPKKEDAVDFIAEYALHPQKSKAVCMPQKIVRFGLMPSQKGNVTDAQLRTIAAWMYDNFPPQGFQGMGAGGRQGKRCRTQ